jgi:hypothetical protein
MTVLTDLATTLPTLLTTEADEAARATGCVRRVRVLSGATLVQTLVLGWLHDPQASLDTLADFAADLGADLTPQALDQRFTPATTRCLAEVLTAALQRVVAATPAAVPLLRRFAGVYVFDTTTVGLPAGLAALFPGCGGTGPEDGQAALKVHACLELGTGRLSLDFGPGRQPDVRSPLARGPLPEGALRLADRGFFDLGVLQDYTDQGVFWITRVPARLVVQPARGPALPLADFLGRQQRDALDLSVRVGAGGRLACRLVARRAPAAVVAKRQAKLLQQAKKKGRKVSAAQQALCGWTIYLTSLSAEQLRWEELWVLARARWQIELLFKLWKSDGGLETSRGQRPERVLSEVYAKLIGQVVQQWVLVTCAGPCVAYSYPKAARRVRRQARVLALRLALPEALTPLLEQLRQRLQQRCRVQPRGKRPSTYERLLVPDRVSDQDEQHEQENELQAA